MTFSLRGTQRAALDRELTADEIIVCPAPSPACPALAAGDYVLEVVPATAGAVNNHTFALALTP